MGGETGDKRQSASNARYPQLAAKPVGKKIADIYTSRLRQFTGNGQYSKQNLNAHMYNDRLAGPSHFKIRVWSAPKLTRPTFEEATSKENEYSKTHIGASFGPSWSTHWFEVKFTLPDDWAHKEHVELHWNSSSEAMIWTKSGHPLQGLTAGERDEWILPTEYRATEEEHTIYIEQACNGMFGNGRGDTIAPPNPDRSFRLSECDLVSVNLEARSLFYDFWIIGDAAREFSDESWEQHRALQVCNEIMDTFIEGDGSNASIKQCRTIAKRYLGNDIDSSKVFGGKRDVLVDGIGHCHIDTCWLWPWAETKRKVARSWSTQCDLLDRYPEYRFCASQAQQYKWLEALYPYAFDRVKSHVKEGGFQPIGGSWVEHDTNMPSGESLVRQFLYGQRYFESRFGQRCRTFWLPDTFGYASQLPQICRLADMNRFFTQKLSWNNINSFPHTTFNWVSLDGSQVICHMTPAETYTAEANFGDVVRSETQHKSMDQDPSSLLVYGKGDGGGGPTFGMIERLRRCRGVSDTVGKLPRVRLGGSVDDFFDRLEEKAATGETDYVTWYGELYFELHRGTYTTQAATKRNNRKAEIMLHDIEYLATLATLEDPKHYQYPKKDIDSMWENVLLCQFHDCLPGSSIEMCYDDSDELYEKVFATGERLFHDATMALGYRTVGKPCRINTLPWSRDVPPDFVQGGLKSEANQEGMSIESREGGEYCMQNDHLTVIVQDGAIISLYDKRAKREIVPKGSKANQLVVFDDKPLYWQAWDVEVYHLESRKELKAGESWISSFGGDKISVSTTTQISDKSSITTTVSLHPVQDDTRLSTVEVEADVDWHETMKFLKVEFPTTITNTEASYETQFGIVRRPTHYNTSWDMAKFEVCCHKWADLSEYGYGVSILNDSKYGFATVGNVMRLSLLRAPKAPDAHADMKKHHIKWAIAPHAGALDHRTVRAGFEFNYPLRENAHPDPESLDGLYSAFKFTSNSSPSLIVDTVKRGEDDEDVSTSDFAPKKGRTVTLRVYDSLGGRSRGTIGFGCVEVTAASKCNVLEDELEDVTSHIGKHGLEAELRAFEVATFKLTLA